MLTMNFELRRLDDEIELLRGKIHELRIASFLAGNVVEFSDQRTRRLYY
jgi:hypothetical protein